ncbi:MAG: hypothetical protein D6714_18840 [Bacteroidetes bacterium]|nr:MAG: hypothetical protein D6714_18840 [Bacteroidota bacterium]
MTHPSNKNQTNKPGTSPKPAVSKTTPPPPPKQKNPLRVFLPVAITVGLILLGVIGYLLYTNAAQERDLMAKISDLQEAENIRAELEDQYNQALTDLEEMRGENADLNALIDQQQSELEEQRNKIARLIRDSKKRKAALEELENLKAQIASYKAEVEELKAQNEMLAMQNDSLASKNLNLQSDLESQLSTNAELENAKAMLVSEKEKLSETVYLASVVKVKDVQVTGLKVKNNGKPVKRKVAKQINLLDVCFTTTENEVTHPGVEKFFIRLINPVGETMAIEELGAGTIVNKKTDEEIRYTHVQEYEYSNDEKQVCFKWKPTVGLQPGSYKVEIYNKGYLCGTGAFSLK